ncbi:MAG: hypothetical protein M4D80_29440 [Myxococcota bacterium]|nr:hypothetical protein [Deltaproteobacteria bacterium]MDQ3339308.1 hypothetical protein [Myxococcota bacterium]
MTIDELERWLAEDSPQRTKLERVREHVAMIRALPDDAYARALRAIKKRVSSPKLAAEVAALIGELAHGRETKPVGASQPEPAPVPWVGTTEDIAEIEAAIAADPDAQGPYTVLGDYWTASGDIRGELIVIGAALAKNPTHKVMRAAWTKLYDEHRRKLWGELAGTIDRILYDVDWYMGFVRACRIPRYGRCAEVVDVLLDDPGPGRFIQRLAIDSDGAEVARVLAKRPRPTLRTLELACFEPSGDLSPLWPSLAHLRTLTIRGKNLALGEIHAPQLERFAIELGTLDNEDELQDLGFLASLWRGDGIPNLRAIALTNCEHTDALCDALVASPIAERLVEIDLREGTMTEAGAALLYTHRDRFPNAQRWNFDLNFLTVEACTRLAALGGEVSTNCQRVTDGNRHAAAYE